MTGEVSTSAMFASAMKTWALTKAKMGRITKLTQKVIKCSRRCRGGVTRWEMSATSWATSVTSCWPRMRRSLL